jgi:hypothetical protein
MKQECESFKKYKAMYEPRCGCISCWDKWFVTNPGRFATARAGIETLGMSAVRKVRGDVYVKQLIRFWKAIEPDAVIPTE